MRKVVGIGETILDIIFRNEQPVKAVAGGSVFNCMVSLARAGVSTQFITELGSDRVAALITHFMEEQGMSTDFIETYLDRKSAVSLAFLNEKNDAEYVFHKDYPHERLCNDLPILAKDDILILGSFYALDEEIRGRVAELLHQAQDAKAIIYYDPNFRASYKDRQIKLAPLLSENFGAATIVRGSKDDFQYIYGLQEANAVYDQEIHFYCPYFICTGGAERLSLCTPSFRKEYDIPRITPVSTIGAGDNFNAGFIYGLIAENIGYDDLQSMDETVWDKVIASGLRFSAEVCGSYDNYVSKEFADTLLKQHRNR